MTDAQDAPVEQLIRERASLYGVVLPEKEVEMMAKVLRVVGLDSLGNEVAFAYWAMPNIVVPIRGAA